MLDQWLRIFDQYDELCRDLLLKPEIIICGGEPLLSRILKNIITEIRKKWTDTRISILTNGTLIEKEIDLGFFKENRCYFQISIDGANASENDFIRGKGSFDSAINGITRLRNKGILPNIQTTLSKRTEKQIEMFFKLAKALHAKELNFTRLIPQGRASGLLKNKQDHILSPIELKNAYENIIYFSEKYGVQTSTNKPLFALIDPKLGSHGKFGFQGVIVDHLGNLKVSSRTPYILGNILEKGLKKLFLHHPVMVQLREGKIRKCGSCLLYRKCAGDRNAAFSKYGSFFEPDPGCWLN